MNLLFIHQNFPAQYRHLAPALAQRHQVLALGDAALMGGTHTRFQGIPVGGYPSPPALNPQCHPYLRRTEQEIRRGQQVARQVWALRQQGFEPDLICCHPGWGEGLFLREVCPETRLLYYFEFFYSTARGAELDFDPEYPTSEDDRLRRRMNNTTFLHALAVADWGVTPSQWQRGLFPESAQARMSVIHEGIDTGLARPDPSTRITLNGTLTLSRADPVITFVNRNLEPSRGFHVFIRALPMIQQRHPEARILILGGDSVSYGRAPPAGQTYRQLMLKELEGQLDLTRIHFLGLLSHEVFLQVLQISRVHVYLTYPFVLSWSLLEAMSAGCLVVGSRTGPVEEVIEDGHNGRLVDFYTQALTDAVSEALTHPARFDALRERARETILECYDLKRHCLPAQQALVETLAAGAWPTVSEV